jgi:hypothetical protein
MEEDDKTVILPKAPPGAAPLLEISCQLASGEIRTARIDQSLCIGRDPSCRVRFNNERVSRRHTELLFDGVRWHVRDLGSSNGSYLDGRRVEQEVLPPTSVLQLGMDGPILALRVVTAPELPETAPAPPTRSIEAAAKAPVPQVVQSIRGGTARPQSSDATESMAEIARRYFDASSDDEGGERTRMIRKAYAQVKTKQKRRYHGVIASVGALLVVSLAFGIYQYVQVRKAREVAIQIFYTMKTLDMQVAKIEETVKERVKAADVQEEIERKRKQVADMEKQYDGFLEEFGIITNVTSEEDRLIFKVARIYGECELVMPKGFAKEVKRYIEKWKSTDRLKQAVARAVANGYAETIKRNMARRNLPPQFLYLALQESGFDAAAVGPETRFGIAKGIWQFIPDTARDYGLTVGPLAGSPEYDAADDRFNFELATQAASRFIRNMYNSDAQASALLVMASYNWGPGNILDRIRKMPENPRDRNFWKLLEQHQVPQETYDYVFYIFAATVIGENPRLFGFDFDNPLQTRTKREQR